MEETVLAPREYRRIEIPAVPVKYNYRTPSLSRRGGVRLHGVADGAFPMGEQLNGLRHRDRAGNKLVDVVNPFTGFVMFTTSPLESPPSGGPAVSGSHNVETLRGTAFKADHRGRTIYHGEYERGQAVVFRTLSDGDAPLPVTRVSRPAPHAKEGRSVKQGRVSARTPGASGPGGTITRADCIGWIRAMARGREIDESKITPAMISDARLMIKAARAKAAKHLKG